MKRAFTSFLLIAILIVIMPSCVKKSHCEAGMEGTYFYLAEPVEMTQGGEAVAVFFEGDNWDKYGKYDSDGHPIPILTDSLGSVVANTFWIKGHVPMKFKDPTPRKVRLVFHPEHHVYFGTYAESLQCIEEIQ